MATTIEDCQQDRRRGRADRAEIHDDGDGRLRPRVPVHQGAVRQGRARQDPVPAGQPHAGHGRLARLLAGAAADAVRDALRRPVLALTDASRRVRLLLRLGHDPRGPDRPLRLAVRRRDRAHQVPGLRRHRAHLPQPLRHRPPVPREHRRLRLQEGVRVDADRGRQARPAHGQAAGAGDPGEDRRARLRAPAAGGDPALHDQGRLRRRGDAPVVHPGRRPRRLAPAPGARVRQRPRRSARPVPERPPLGQLDVRRPLRARVRAQGRRDRAPARVHAGPETVVAK